MRKIMLMLIDIFIIKIFWFQFSLWLAIKNVGVWSMDVKFSSIDFELKSWYGWDKNQESESAIVIADFSLPDTIVDSSLDICLSLHQFVNFNIHHIIF